MKQKKKMEQKKTEKGKNISKSKLDFSAREQMQKPSNDDREHQEEFDVDFYHLSIGLSVTAGVCIGCAMHR